jgi:hypothetical protein
MNLPWPRTVSGLLATLVVIIFLLGLFGAIVVTGKMITASILALAFAILLLNVPVP